MISKHLPTIVAALLLAPAAVKATDKVVFGPERIDSPGMALIAGKVIPVVGEPIVNGTVLIRDSKILAIGPREEITVPKGWKVIEKPDSLLYPGFIEAHSHIGSRSMRDLNDSIQQINTGMRSWDFISTDHDMIVRARAGGITALLYIPGSGSNLAGWGTLMKTWGRTSQEALIRFPGVLKIAQAGNPERGAPDLGAGPMGMNAQLREIFRKGHEYAQAWADYEQGRRTATPDFDPSLEHFRPLFKHAFPVCVHTQAYQVMLSTLRICGDEYGLWYYPSHSSFDGYKLAPVVKQYKCFINCGPRKYQYDRKTGRMVGIDFEYWKVLGEDVMSQNTDAPVIPQEELPFQSAMACRLGLPPHVAVKGLTINNARLLGVQNRMGSIEKGKDADLVFWSGDPIDPCSRVEMTIINGHIAYDPARDGRIF